MNPTAVDGLCSNESGGLSRSTDAGRGFPLYPGAGVGYAYGVFPTRPGERRGIWNTGSKLLPLSTLALGLAAAGFVLAGFGLKPQEA